MQHSDHSTNTGLLTDTFGTLSVKGFLVRLNKQLEILADKLQREQELLINGNADQISDAAQEKMTHIHELSDFIANYFKNGATASSNANVSLENSLQAINEICVKHEIIEWNETQDLIKYCHDISDENSILLANRLKSTNNALDTLYSLAGSSQNKTYDNQGHSQYPRSSRRLASV